MVTSRTVPGTVNCYLLYYRYDSTAAVDVMLIGQDECKFKETFN